LKAVNGARRQFLAALPRRRVGDVVLFNAVFGTLFLLVLVRDEFRASPP